MKSINSSKKILIVTENFYPEQFKINDLAWYLRDKEFEVSVLTQNPIYPYGRVFKGYKNKLFQKEIVSNVKIYRVFSYQGENNTLVKIFRYLNFMILSSFVALFIGRRFDHIFGFNVGPLTDMVPVVLLNKIYKKDATIWVQDLWPDTVFAYGLANGFFSRKFLHIFSGRVYGAFQKILISSPGFEEDLLKYFKEKKPNITFAPNWADKSLNSDKKRILLGDDKKIQFTFAGNIGKFQNLDNVIHAFQSLTDEDKDKVQLNIIGDGSYLKKLKKIKVKNLNIVFFGMVERKNIFLYLNESDFLILSLRDLPVFHKTIPAKFQTYLAAKKPILGLIKGEVSDLINKYKLGLTADPEDTNGIINLLENCIKNKEALISSFSQKNRMLLEDQFNKDKVLETITKKIIS